MISNPKYGWCEFNLGNFKGNPSYLTDVPMELLDTFVEFFCDGKFAGCVNFDEEGSEFYLVLTASGAYIIEEREDPKLIIVDGTVRELAEELMDDISTNLKGWAKEFSVDVGLTQNKNRDKEIINERINLFKAKIKLLQETFDSYDQDRKKEKEIEEREKRRGRTREEEEEVHYNKNDYLIIEGKEE